jgi:hypothetical protein
MKAGWFKSFRCGGLTGELPIVIFFGFGRGNVADGLQQSVVVDLPLQCFDAIALLAGDAITRADVDLLFASPFMHGLGNAAILGRDRFDGGPQRWLLPSVLLNHANSAFTYLG